VAGLSKKETGHVYKQGLWESFSCLRWWCSWSLSV